MLYAFHGRLARAAVAVSVMFAGLALLPGAARAADQTAAGPVVSIAASDASLKDVAASLTKQAKVPVLAEPALKATFSGTFNQAPLEQVLDFVAKSSQVVWQKVYVPATTPQASLLTTATATASALAGVTKTQTGGVYDSEHKTVITLSARPADSADTEAALKTLGLTQVYLITAKPPEPEKAAKSAEGDTYTQLAQQQREQFLKMTPEERQQALEQSMQNELAMSPTERAEYAKARAEAFRALMQSDSPTAQQYRQSMRDTMRSLHDQGLMPGRPGGPGNRRQNGPNGQ